MKAFISKMNVSISVMTGFISKMNVSISEMKGFIFQMKASISPMLANLELKLLILELVNVF